MIYNLAHCCRVRTFLGRVGVALEAVVQVILGAVQAGVRARQAVHVTNSAAATAAALAAVVETFCTQRNNELPAQNMTEGGHLPFM